MGSRIMKKETKHIDSIVVKGARTHNLKNISLEMPRNKMVVITGMSGSGKSSLAFDTIFAEGQRRYMESLSSYARQFLKQMQKPDVDEISGLSPAISIDQKSAPRNPRSTVGTITEIYDYLRVLYSRIGRPHCLICGEEIKKLSNEEILNFILEKVEKLKKENVHIDYVNTIDGLESNYHYVLWYDVDRTILVKHEHFKYDFKVDEAPKWIYLSSLGESVDGYHERIADYLGAHPEVKLAFQPGTYQIKLGTDHLKRIFCLPII